ncbi:hypothetical protein JKP88DRAFT_279205 [Tribonema minus]|uniref:Uncharacterized protein n=1 Tax=Tribonema minus TaxID=303371 RepID=A0A836CC86_9STRA|nr:hypothetical protein JKP88DRAFT_279203 [Tribonema minus]KAG5181046.1 hypothetical protein JKP88DRAFT_279204 [Tribonema minus]KAG5181047.1 hypothetical protein JKP88DRAFT_279205 [Tribonema minus]
MEICGDDDVGADRPVALDIHRKLVALRAERDSDFQRMKAAQADLATHKKLNENDMAEAYAAVAKLKAERDAAEAALRAAEAALRAEEASARTASATWDRTESLHAASLAQETRECLAKDAEIARLRAAMKEALMAEIAADEGFSEELKRAAEAVPDEVSRHRDKRQAVEGRGVESGAEERAAAAAAAAAASISSPDRTAAASISSPDRTAAAAASEATTPAQGATPADVDAASAAAAAAVPPASAAAASPPGATPAAVDAAEAAAAAAVPPASAAAASPPAPSSRPVQDSPGPGVPWSELRAQTAGKAGDGGTPLPPPAPRMESEPTPAPASTGPHVPVRQQVGPLPQQPHQQQQQGVPPLPQQQQQAVPPPQQQQQQGVPPPQQQQQAVPPPQQQQQQGVPPPQQQQQCVPPPQQQQQQCVPPPQQQQQQGVPPPQQQQQQGVPPPQQQQQQGVPPPQQQQQQGVPPPQQQQRPAALPQKPAAPVSGGGGMPPPPPRASGAAPEAARPRSASVVPPPLAPLAADGGSLRVPPPLSTESADGEAFSASEGDQGSGAAAADADADAAPAAPAAARARSEEEELEEDAVRIGSLLSGGEAMPPPPALYPPEAFDLGAADADTPKRDDHPWAVLPETGGPATRPSAGGRAGGVAASPSSSSSGRPAPASPGYAAGGGGKSLTANSVRRARDFDDVVRESSPAKLLSAGVVAGALPPDVFARLLAAASGPLAGEEMHFSGNPKQGEAWRFGRHIAPAPEGALEPWKAALAAACGPLSVRATWRAGFRLRAQLDKGLTAQPFYRDDFVGGEATAGLCLLVALSGWYPWLAVTEGAMASESKESPEVSEPLEPGAACPSRRPAIRALRPAPPACRKEGEEGNGREERGVRIPARPYRESAQSCIRTIPSVSRSLWVSP